MKTTLKIPDALFRRAKSAASERGIPLRELSEALAERLRSARGREKPWLRTFGKLRSLRRETVRISPAIDQEFGQMEPEDRQ